VTRPTLAAAAASRVGTLSAGRVIGFMVSWSICRDALGHSPSIEEYTEFWGEHERTVYRHQARFREAFPGEDTPDRLLDAAAAAWDRRQGVAALSSVPMVA